MNVGKLVNNLQSLFGMLPGTIRILASDGYGPGIIPFSFSKKKIKTDESPYKLDPYELNDAIHNSNKHANLVLREITSKEEYYVFNFVLKAFLGRDDTFYPYNLVCEECKFSSMRSASLAISKYSGYSHKSFRIYERMSVEYFNAHEVTTSLISQLTDEIEIHDFGSEHPVYTWLTIVNGLLEENYIPNYEKIRIYTDERFNQIKNLDNRGCWAAINQENVDELVLFLKSILVHTQGSKPYTVEEYIHGVDE